MGKKGLILVLSFIIIFISVFSTSSLALETGEVINVGYIPSDNFITNIDDFGDEGLGYEIFKKIESMSDLRFEFIEIDGDPFEALKDGTIDISGFYYLTDERKEEFAFSQTPYTTLTISLASKEELFYNDPKELDGKTVATYEGNMANDLLDEYLKENNVSVIYKNASIHDYLDLDADFYLTYSTDYTENYFYTVLNLDRRFSYVVSNKENESILTELDNVMQQLVVEEGSFFNELQDKYNNHSFDLLHRGLTRDEVSTLQEKTLSVGYIENHRPLTYTDSNGNANGALVEIMNSLASEFDFKVDYVPYSANDEIPQVDVLISAIGDTQKVMENFIPSEQYYEMQIYSIIDKEKLSNNEATIIDILKSSKTIGTLRYLYTDFGLFSESNYDTEVIFYDTFDELLNAYKENNIDIAVFTNSGTTYANAFLSDIDNYTFAADFDLGLRFALSKDLSHEYLNIFNVMLDKVSESEYKEIVAKHTTTYFPERSLVEYLIDFWPTTLLAVLAICSVFLLVIILLKRSKEKSLVKSYMYEPVTGIMSDAYFMSETQRRLNNIKFEKHELISFDIDMFSVINNNYNVEKGYAVINAIAKSLKDAFKNYDVMYSRRSSDRFLVYRKATDGESIKEIYTNYIVPNVRKEIGIDYELSLSFGMVYVNSSGTNLNTLVAYADYARERGKNSNTTTFVTFDDKMKEVYNKKLDITYKMEKALSSREFKIHFQPKIDFKTFKVVGAEALARWSPERGILLYPDDFVKVFEENGFISKLDLYIFEDLCRFISKNRDKVNIPVISSNLSAKTIESTNIKERLVEIAKKYDISPSMIELEITESAMSSKKASFLKKVRNLKTAGFKIAIDDFGAGLSSLNRLAHIEADVVKLSEDFFDTRKNTDKNVVIIENVIRMAKGLNMQVVAEGIETTAQANFLREHNCDLAQGFYFAKPMEIDDFVELLSSDKTFKIK